MYNLPIWKCVRELRKTVTNHYHSDFSSALVVTTLLVIVTYPATHFYLYLVLLTMEPEVKVEDFGVFAFHTLGEGCGWMLDC